MPAIIEFPKPFDKIENRGWAYYRFAGLVDKSTKIIDYETHLLIGMHEKSRVRLERVNEIQRSLKHPSTL